MNKEKINGLDGLGDVKDKKDIDGNKVTHTSFMSQSIVYTLVDETLWAHRERDTLNMFDCVYTIFHMIEDLPSKSNKTDIIGKRLTSLVNSVEMKDCDGTIIKIPAYNMMRAAFDYRGYHGKWVIDLVDCCNVKVHVFVHDLYQVYDFIGRVLMISLFELLQSKDLYIPEELYVTRRKLEKIND